MLAKAPWLIEPTWSVISKNQQLNTFKKNFEHFWKQRHKEEINLSIGDEYEKKRPDFTLVSVGHMLHIVEIKKAGYEFADTDFERLIAYVYAIRDFWDEHKEVPKDFPGGWCIDLIADGVKLQNLSNQESFKNLVEKDEVKRVPWKDFLYRTENAHQMFLDINKKADSRDLS